MEPRRDPPLIIAVIGGSKPSAEAREWAYRVGGELARRGAIVVCGGLEGVMEAVSQGAAEAGGITVGRAHDPVDGARPRP